VESDWEEIRQKVDLVMRVPAWALAGNFNRETEEWLNVL